MTRLVVQIEKKDVVKTLSGSMVRKFLHLEGKKREINYSRIVHRRSTKKKWGAIDRERFSKRTEVNSTRVDNSLSLFLSHKLSARRFIREETRSKFLEHVTEVKEGPFPSIPGIYIGSLDA